MKGTKKINYTHGVFTFLPWNLFLSSNCWLHVGSYHKTFKVHLFLFDEVMKQLWALFCFGKFFNKRQNTLRPLIVDPFLILWFSVQSLSIQQSHHRLPSWHTDLATIYSKNASLCGLIWMMSVLSISKGYNPDFFHGISYPWCLRKSSFLMNQKTLLKDYKNIKMA